MRYATLILILLAGTLHAEGFSLKGDTLGVSLEDWQAKHRHLAAEYRGKREFAPMCSDAVPNEYNAYLTKSPKLGIGEVTCELYYPYQREKPTVANVEAEIRYYFNTANDGHQSGNGLRTIIATFDSKSFGQVKAAMITKWGVPTISRAQELQNLFGATLEGAELVWIEGDHRMLLTEFNRSVSESRLTLLSQPLTDEWMHRKDSKSKPDSDDL